DLRVLRVALLEHGEGAFVGRERRVVLATVSAHARDQEERLDRIVEAIELFVELERLLGELERLDVRVDRGGALRRLPGILGGLVRHLSEQIVVRERRQEVPDALAEHRFVCDRDPPVQLNTPADEQGVVRDLLDDRVLEAIPAFATAPGSTNERIDSSTKNGFPPARATILLRSSSGIQSNVASMIRAASSSDSGSRTSWLKFVRTGRGSGDPGPARCARSRRI